MSVPEIPAEWYHSRLQAVGRAQSRYLLLLLLITAYTLGLSVTAEGNVNVAFLGVSPPRCIVTAFAVSVLSVLLLALFGTFEAAQQVYDILVTRLGDAAKGMQMYQVDEHPNVADFLSYTTMAEGKPGPLTHLGSLVLYPLPVTGVAAWTVALWWAGVRLAPYVPGWLLWVHVFNSLLVALVIVRTLMFLRHRWQRFRVERKALRT